MFEFLIKKTNNLFLTIRDFVFFATNIVKKLVISNKKIFRLQQQKQIVVDSNMKRYQNSNRQSQFFDSHRRFVFFVDLQLFFTLIDFAFHIKYSKMNHFIDDKND